MTTDFWSVDDGEESYKPWTLADIYADLALQTTIAEMLDVSTHRMHKWIDRRERIHSPAPLVKLGNLYVYSKQEWKDWFKDWMDPNKSVGGRTRWGRHDDSKWVNAVTVSKGKPFFTHNLVCPTCQRSYDQ